MAPVDSDDGSASTTANELLSLKQQRSSMKRNITNLKVKIDKEGAKSDATILECQLQILESSFKQLSHIQTQIERISVSDDNYRSEIEEVFIAAKSNLVNILNVKRRPSMVENSFLSGSNLGSHHSSRLPSLKLPKFSGKYIEYSRFMHTYKTLVHDDPSLSQIDKFNYLIDCLSGQALAVVQPFQVNEDNYQRALDRLNDRFDNKVLIFNDNIKSLFSLPAMSKEDPTTLRSIIDSFASIKGALLSIGSEKDLMNALLIHVMLSKLDFNSKAAYDERQEYKELPTFESCYESLCCRCQLLETRASFTEVESTQHKANQKGTKSSKTFVNSNTLCAYCQSKDHFIGRCNKFSSITVSQRFDYVKQNALCVNCLSKGHQVAKCPSKSRCRVCNGQHHTTLHRYAATPQGNSSLTTSEQHGPQSALSPSPQFGDSPRLPTSLLVRTTHRAILPTAVVLIKDGYGIFQPARALLDSCSEINFITQETAKRLHLKQQYKHLDISGIANISTQIKFEVQATLKSRVSTFEWTSQFAVTKSISSYQPSDNINIAKWNVPGENLPSIINTTLGWVVAGKFDSTISTHPRFCIIATRQQTDELHEAVQKFWEVEEYMPTSVQYSEEESLCEQHFVENTGFSADGRVQVRLPFKDSSHLLGNSLQTACRRFMALERRLEREPMVKQMYIDFMNEYEALGHMSPISDLQLEQFHYFMPHHSVLRLQSASTKLRVVFDASAKTSNNRSLNDCLMVGPTTQQDLITTLLAFRLNKYAIMADICKMYRQFWVYPEDRKFQRIVWRSDSTQPLQYFELNTITYGTSAAPFLAVRSLSYIADAYAHLHPVGAQVLKHDLYVDDVLAGADTNQDLQVKKFDLINILKKAKLQLSKWHSNCADVLEGSVESVCIQPTDTITKALGMAWKPPEDIFCFQYEVALQEELTKRSILSVTARIFDLLGLLSPVVIRNKILLQVLWMHRLNWDDKLPSHFANIWNSILDDLPKINHMEIPRYVFTSLAYKCQKHGFADASQRAFGCCIYIRAFINGSYKTTLLIAKSKVAPVKAQSLPRLELCAAVLLMRTWKKFKEKLAPFIEDTYFWTDSKIVLLWLETLSSKLNTFVANRVSYVQEYTLGILWRHVPSKMNPADIVSRGCSAAELPNTMWFNGPTFLEHNSSTWPATTIDISIPKNECRKVVSFKCSTSASASLCEQLIERHSSYSKILRIIVYIHRAFNKVPVNRYMTPLLVDAITHIELKNAFLFIIAEIQHSIFLDEIRNIQGNKLLTPSLQKLSPFLCYSSIFNQQVQLLRVGGRLAQAPISMEARFPLLLPKSHPFVYLFVSYTHRQHLHAGPKILVGLIRQQIWIINARDVVRRVVRNCVHCFRYRPKLMNQVMGNLPADRLKAQRPFLISGVDFCGPFATSYRIRSKVPYKTYVAIFICFASKAVHIELVLDLSTNSFLNCLRRFVGRRGVPQRIYCDNATNFIGANNKLKEFFHRYIDKPASAEIHHYCSSTGFEFCFIPPRSPHFGGLWEAAVKSAKTLLLKNISQALLTYEELLTLVVDVEAILNSRLLVENSEDPNNGEALTPSHLLIGTQLLSIPEPQLDTTAVAYSNRWQRLTFLKQQFWRQWMRDYILELQSKSKWLTPEYNIQPGQMVIVHEDNLPSQQWLLARVTKAIAESDGRVRVVDIKTPKGCLRRAIHKLAPLPISC